MPPEEIRSPFITAVLDRRDHPDTPPPATVPLTDFWLAPPPAEGDD